MGIEVRLKESCSKITSTRNKFGDIEFGSSEARNCLFRPISLLSLGNSHRESVDIDGMFWLDIDDDWSLGDIILYEAQYYRIDKLITAKRRVADNAAKFYKAEVILTRQIS